MQDVRMGILTFLFGTAKNDKKEFNLLREVIGDPFSSEASEVIDKIIRYKLKLPDSFELSQDQCLSELECEEIDIVEILMAVEDQYLRKFTYPDWKDNDLNGLTVSDLVKPLDKFLKSA